MFKDAYAANTHRAYAHALDRFSAFLDGRAPDDAIVAAFLEAEAAIRCG